METDTDRTHRLIILAEIWELPIDPAERLDPEALTARIRLVLNGLEFLLLEHGLSGQYCTIGNALVWLAGASADNAYWIMENESPQGPMPDFRLDVLEVVYQEFEERLNNLEASFPTLTEELHQRHHIFKLSSILLRTIAIHRFIARRYSFFSEQARHEIARVCKLHTEQDRFPHKCLQMARGQLPTAIIGAQLSGPDLVTWNFICNLGAQNRSLV